MNLGSQFKNIKCPTQTEVLEKPLECRLYFHGYQGLKDAKKLKAIAGVSVEVFQMMLLYLKGYQSRSLTIEDHLLILLMKLKMGISFSVISVFFGLHRTTVQRIFTTLLSILSRNTNHLIRYQQESRLKLLCHLLFWKITLTLALSSIAFTMNNCNSTFFLI